MQVNNIHRQYLQQQQHEQLILCKYQTFNHKRDVKLDSNLADICGGAKPVNMSLTFPFDINIQSGQTDTCKKMKLTPQSYDVIAIRLVLSHKMKDYFFK